MGPNIYFDVYVTINFLFQCVAILVEVSDMEQKAVTSGNPRTISNGVVAVIIEDVYQLFVIDCVTS